MMSPEQNPYAPPAAAEGAEAPTILPFRSFWSPRLLLASLVMFGASIVFVMAVGERIPLRFRGGGFWLTAALAAAAVLSGLYTLARRKTRLTLTGLGVLGLSLSVLASLAMMGMGALLGLLSSIEFRRGRQLRRGTRLLLPRVRTGAAYCGVSFDDLAQQLPADCDRDALAQQWRENGRTEHASVAAFAKHSLSLVALGAPPRLIADAQRDALDEIRHTELCFSLARALDGVSASPAAFPEAQSPEALPASRAVALAQLAVHSLIDGALHEGVSARIIAKLARRAEVETIRQVLLEIAADEGRHASHAWDVVRFCLDEGGAPVLAALDGALLTLPHSMSSPLPPAAEGGSWERFGIHGAALERDEYEKARSELVRRVQALSTRESVAA